MTTDESAIAATLEALHEADRRLVRTVDALAPEDWRAPSSLPGWSRAHVIAHLALNAEGFSGALEAIDRGMGRPIYPSDQARDEGIAELAAEATEEIRDRLFAATVRFRDAVVGLTGSQWQHRVERLPGGPVWPATDLPAARRREVEIHHVDLDADYTLADWPASFAVALLDRVTVDQAAGGADAFSVRATDLGRTWSVGAEAPVVIGAGAAIAWWLTGRGDGIGVTVEGGGALPRLDAWRRAPD
jgi:maleylpyruvate isomerase